MNFLIAILIGFSGIFLSGKETSQLSFDQKISKLFILPACPNLSEELAETFYDLVQIYHLDSAILKHCDFQSLQDFNQRINNSLFYYIDGENGLGNMMQDRLRFPLNMTLGAVQNMQLIQKLGFCIGQQLRSVGVYVNFAPVVDVNTNPKNPIIHMRSFGDDPIKVTQRAEALINGMHKANVGICAKHFPGHGDVQVDSHCELPVMDSSLEEIQQTHLYPFHALSSKLDMIMSAHILFPKIDNMPASMSKPVLNDVLRKDLKFKGLIITDALNMDAIRKNLSPGIAAIAALKAGADLLLYGEHRFDRVEQIYQTFPQVFAAVKEAYLSGELDTHELDQKIERIEKFKKEKRRKTKVYPLNPMMIQQSLYDCAMTLICDREQKTPLSLENYHEIFLEETCPDVLENNIIIYLSGKKLPNSEWIQKMEQDKNVVWVLLSSPYLLKDFPPVSTLILGYEKNELSIRSVHKVLTGKKKPEGILPVRID